MTIKASFSILLIATALQSLSQQINEFQNGDEYERISQIDAKFLPIKETNKNGLLAGSDLENFIKNFKAESNVVIDFNSEVRSRWADEDGNLEPMIGFLHSLPNPKIREEFVKPLRPNSWRTRVWNEMLYDTLNSYNPDFLYQLTLAGYIKKVKLSPNDKRWPANDFSRWIAFSDSIAKGPTGYLKEKRIEKEATGEELKLSFDIWNEPNHDKMWPQSKEEFYKVFTETLSDLNSKYPNVKISGPSTTGYESREYATGLLDYMMEWKKNNPEKPLKLHIFSVHALGGQEQDEKMADAHYFADLVYNNKKYEDLGIEFLMYNEYLKQGPHHKNFSWAIAYLQEFEKAGVRYAIRTCWPPNCKDGSITGLLTINEEGYYYANHLWYGYKQYANMRGKRYYSTTDDKDISILAGTNKRGRKIVLLGNTNLSSKKMISLETKGISGRVNEYKITDDGLKLVKTIEGSSVPIALNPKESIYLVIQE